MPGDRRWLAPILFSAWFGLVSGFAESLVRLVRQTTSGIPLHLGMYVLWMPACANFVLFLLVGLALAVVARLLPRGLPPRPLLTVLAAFAALDPLWVFTPGLHIFAVMALAVGFGVQAGGLLARRLDGFDRTVRRTLPVLAAAMLLIAVGIEGSRRLHESRTLASTPADPAKRPNVLLLVLDTVRSMDLSAYGYFRHTTPTMERLAAQGVKFDHAISTAPWTLPSHASIMTGRWLHEQSSSWEEPLDGTWPTLAELLDREGYATAGFVANVAYCSRDNGLARGFAHYEDYPLNWRQILFSSRLGIWVTRRPALDRRFGPRQRWTRKTATRVTDNFLAWQKRQPGDRAWFAFLNLLDAHRDYYAPWTYDTLFRGDSALAPRVPRQTRGTELDARYRPVPVVRYDRAIRYMDDEIGRMLAELERRGALANTLVIITSDHGEEFGEHGMDGHGASLYYPLISVPLVMALPGRLPAGTVVPATVSLRNLPATIMDLTGSPSPGPFPGASLARYWSGAIPTTPDTALAEVNFAWNRPEWFPVSKGNMKSVVTGADHLIRNGDGSHEFYDVRADMWEQHDRAGDSTLAGQVTALGALLQALPSLPIPAGRHPTPAGAKDQEGDQL